jgi:hypothetical protein
MGYERTSGGTVNGRSGERRWRPIVHHHRHYD